MRIKDFLHIKGGFGGQFAKLSAKERLLVCKNGKFLRTAKKGTCKKKFLYVKNGFE